MSKCVAFDFICLTRNLETLTIVSILNTALSLSLSFGKRKFKQFVYYARAHKKEPPYPYVQIGITSTGKDEAIYSFRLRAKDWLPCSFSV